MGIRDLSIDIFDRIFCKCYEYELEGATIKLKDGREWRIDYKGKPFSLHLTTVNKKKIKK